MQVHVGCSGWFYWIYFDNDREGFAINNAQELMRQLRERGLEVM
jgi:uncharacterized protein YecE (DUF72 family)